MWELPPGREVSLPKGKTAFKVPSTRAFKHMSVEFCCIEQFSALPALQLGRTQSLAVIILAQLKRASSW